MFSSKLRRFIRLNTMMEFGIRKECPVYRHVVSLSRDSNTKINVLIDSSNNLIDNMRITEVESQKENGDVTILMRVDYNTVRNDSIPEFINLKHQISDKQIG